MVGGDRRSPPRHKAKGGGGKGKGSGGNEGLSCGSDCNEKSDGANATARSVEEFKFGKGNRDEGLLHSSDSTKQGFVKEMTSRFGAAVPNPKSAASVAHDLDKASSSTVPNYVNSWAAAVEEQEELDKTLANSMENSMLEFDTIKSGMIGAAGTSCCSHSPPTSHTLIVPNGSVAMESTETKQVVKSHSPSSAGMKTSDGNAPELLQVNPHGCDLNSKAAGMNCDNSLQTPIGNSHEAIHTSMDCNNVNVDCWKSENFGKMGCADNTIACGKSNCTQGARPFASIGNSAAIAGEEHGFVNESNAELNIKPSSTLAAMNGYVKNGFLEENLPARHGITSTTMAAATSLGHTNFREVLKLKHNSKSPSSMAADMEINKGEHNSVSALDMAAAKTSSFHKPNAWKRIGHHKINLHELGTITENGKSVCFDENAYERNKGRLDKGLVGKLIGRKLPLHILDQELSRRWSHVGGFRTILVGGDCFLCIFESMEARDNILMGGPWLIMGHLIGMDRWSSEFDPRSLSGLTSPVWARLSKLPLLYWDNITIGRIAAMIGEPLWIDAQTTEWGRSEYARVCVRLDLSKSLPTGVWIQGKKTEFFQPVEYEGISLLCFHCGVIGHKAEVCCHKTTTSPSKTSPGIRETTPMKDHHMDHSYAHNVGGCSSIDQTMNQPFVQPIVACDSTFVDDPDEGSRYGPWILVSRKRKTLPKQHPMATKNQPTTVQMSYRAKKDATVSSPIEKPIIGEPVQEPMVVESVTKSHSIEEQVNSAATAPPLAPIGSSPLHEAVMPSVSLEVAPSHQPNNRCGKSRVSRAHFEKELLQLGPIALKSRKRKKQVSIAGLQQGLKALANEEGTVQNDCGGDDSPSSGK